MRELRWEDGVGRKGLGGGGGGGRWEHGERGVGRWEVRKTMSPVTS